MTSPFAIKRDRPLWSWKEVIAYWLKSLWHRYALEKQEAQTLGFGAVVVCLFLVILSQAIHAQSQSNWVCTRAGFAPIWINNKLIPATPCVEETNIRNGEVRETEFAKVRKQNGY